MKIDKKIKIQQFKIKLSDFYRIYFIFNGSKLVSIVANGDSTSAKVAAV